MSDRRIVGFIRARRSLAVEDRRDAADHAAARVALDRLAGERLPDVGRVAVPAAASRARRSRWSRRRPATAPLTASTPGFDARNAANRASRAAASDPEVHHDTTSSCFVLFVALVGASPPQAPARARAPRRPRRRGAGAAHAAPPAGRGGPAARAPDRASRTGSPPVTLGSALQVVERVEPDDREAPGGDDEREGRARRVHELALHQRHDRAAHDRHHEAGRAELRRRPEALQGDAVDRREHQRQAERQRDDRDHAGHVRARHREQAQPHGQEGEHREHLGRADAARSPRSSGSARRGRPAG